MGVLKIVIPNSKIKEGFYLNGDDIGLERLEGLDSLKSVKSICTHSWQSIVFF